MFYSKGWLQEKENQGQWRHNLVYGRNTLVKVRESGVSGTGKFSELTMRIGCYHLQMMQTEELVHRFQTVQC